MMNGPGKHVVTMYPEYCMTFDEDLNTIYIGKSPYNSLQFYKDGGNIRLPPIASDINNCKQSYRALLLLWPTEKER